MTSTPAAVRRAGALACALLLGACSPTDAPGDTDPAGEQLLGTPTPDTQGAEEGGSIQVGSFVAVPPPQNGNGTWSFPADQRSFAARVSLDGRGTVEARLTLSREPDGEVLAVRDELVEVDGPSELRFDEMELPEEGGYTLELTVSGPGVQQSSTVSIRRG